MTLASDSIGKRLKAIMDEREISVNKLAHMSQTPPSYISNLLKDEMRPTIQRVEMIANALNVSPAFLAYGVLPPRT